jgi:hypothetical protein
MIARMSGIVWIASYPKSGNTWLRFLLANYLEDSEAPLAINHLGRYSYSDAEARFYVGPSGKREDALSAQETQRLRPRVQAELASLADRVFVKTHNALARLDGTPTIAPESTWGALYVVRNPLDVVVSFADHYGLSIDRAATMLANERNALLPHPGMVFQFLASWSTHVQSWAEVSAFPCLVLRYEDMAADPPAALARMLEFLAWPVERARLARAVRFSAFDELRRQEERDGFIERSGKAERFFRRGRAGGWREVLTPAQVQAIVERHHAVMRRFGYLTDDGQPT